VVGGSNAVEVRKIKYIVLTLAGAAAVAAGTIVTAAQDVVEIRMRGRYFSEPATVRITVAVEPDAKNRVLIIQADGDRLFRSSEVPLEGEKEQRIHSVEFKNLPAGYYTVRAEVLSNRESRGMAEELLVVGDPSVER
jgi:hypothetical protein